MVAQRKAWEQRKMMKKKQWRVFILRMTSCQLPSSSRASNC